MTNSLIFLKISLLIVAFLTLGTGGNPVLAADASLCLGKMMDKHHTTLEVYSDSHGAGNHFVCPGRMPAEATDTWLPPMKDCNALNPHTGKNAIECQFKGSIAPYPYWGGWYFLNGVLSGDDVAPKPNWGEVPGAGLDLRGAAKPTLLTFWARGAVGGERVEFFCGGVGYREGRYEQIMPYPDSFRKVTTGPVTLSKDWQPYALNLAGNDLSYVLGGFGWVADKAANNGKNIKFYLDDIRYNKQTLTKPRFLVSYKTNPGCVDFDVVMRNVAFTYDNAVALLAFLAAGQNDRARLLADALVYAYFNDRFYRDPVVGSGKSRRLRNAYQGGDLVLWPGWKPNGYANTVRMPGFNFPNCFPNCGAWCEDEFQVSTHAGNVAWAMLALLGYYEKFGGDKYLNTARALGKWVEAHCRSATGAGGYTGGYEGWEKPNLPTKLTYKATEHNIDLYAAFKRLAILRPGETYWQNRANHARKFVEQMWNEAGQHFWTGTLPDGITINKNREQIPLDIQAWANLAFKDTTKYRSALTYAETHHRKGCGYDFNHDYQGDVLAPDGIWYEGTAQMALAYNQAGKPVKWQSLLNCLHNAQVTGGCLPAANKDGLTTGFDLPGGDPWLYFRRSHVGATAWLVLAEKGFNPFWP